MTTPTRRPHARVEVVSKRYGATVALDRVSVSIDRGTVHALVGENGAGKSTLGKIIGGVVRPDAGKVEIEGSTVSFRSPRSAIELGITVIAQELALVPTLSVLDNVFLGQEQGPRGFLSRSEQSESYEQLTSRYGFAVDPTALVRNLPLAERQKVEILRALARDADLIVMDEPTAALGGDDTLALLEAIQAISRQDRTVVFVSHFLDEVLQVADDITVLRDGSVVATQPASATTHDGLIEQMIGRTIESVYPALSPPGDQEVLKVEQLGGAGFVHNVSFTVHAGEIVGLGGLVGSGRSEVARLIYGDEPRTSGQVEVRGQPLEARHPAAAIRAGVALIPEDRKSAGLLLQRSLRENVMLPVLDDYSYGPFTRRAAEAEQTAQLIDAAGIKAPNGEARAGELSGGNQQKILLARWMARLPAVLLADEPTRGVDIGAKRGIYELLRDLADRGLAVLLITSDLDELLGLSHRVLVMRRGRLVADLPGEAATEQSVMGAALGQGAGKVVH